MMENLRRQNGFFKTLLRTGRFWLSLVGIAVGIGFSIWFDLEVKGAPLYDTIFSLLIVTVVGLAIVIWVFHRIHTGKIPMPKTPQEGRLLVFREMTATIPLSIAVIATVYFVITNQISYIPPVVLSGLILWLILRSILRKKMRH